MSIRTLPTARLLAAVLAVQVVGALGHAQPQANVVLRGAEDSATANGDAAGDVDVEPVADDDQIRARLQRILEATQWFADAEIRVEEGVVFLSGQTQQAEHKDWAGRLATRTQDVVAVVNRIEVVRPSPWDFSPAWNDLRSLGESAVHVAPLLLVAVALIVASWYAARFATRVGDIALRRRMKNRLIRQVASNALAVPVFLVGIYFVLRISGLTQLALTVLGGTGLVGLVVGFAFRDIAENFLASILISVQRPFEVGDHIEVEHWDGFVQRVTLRGTLLMTLDGNHVQIPNATVYKSTLRNFTANENTRFDFVIGIGNENAVKEAQEIILGVLTRHPAVLNDPEPMVLAETLGAATVNLRVYLWVNVHEFSGLKVKSSVIRQTKAAVQRAGVTLPDEAREVVFPEGVPIVGQFDAVEEARSAMPATEQPAEAAFIDTAPDELTATDAEGDLVAEASEIETQAKRSRTLDAGPDLLAGT